MDQGWPHQDPENQVLKLVDFATDVQVAIIAHDRYHELFGACVAFIVIPIGIKVAEHIRFCLYHWHWVGSISC